MFTVFMGETIRIAESLAAARAVVQTEYPSVRLEDLETVSGGYPGYWEAYDLPEVIADIREIPTVGDCSKALALDIWENGGLLCAALSGAGETEIMETLKSFAARSDRPRRWSQRLWKYASSLPVYGEAGDLAEVVVSALESEVIPRGWDDLSFAMLGCLRGLMDGDKWGCLQALRFDVLEALWSMDVKTPGFTPGVGILNGEYFEPEYLSAALMGLSAMEVVDLLEKMRDVLETVVSTVRERWEY